MSKNVLVTGGLGFIGSHTVVELISSGYNPIIIDDLSNSRDSVLQGITDITKTPPQFIQGNFADLDILNSIFKKYDISGVIHFAAFKAVGES